LIVDLKLGDATTAAVLEMKELTAFGVPSAKLNEVETRRAA
jgi:hypothetical protein